MACGDFQDFQRRTASDKVLRDKAFNIAKNPKFDGLYGYKFFDKKSASVPEKSASCGSLKNETEQNKKLAEELH